MTRGWAEKLVLRLAGLIGKKEGMPLDVVTPGIQGMITLGWAHDLDTVEPVPPGLRKRLGKETCTPWWVSPTGERVRGLKAAVLRAAADIKVEVREPPSEMAQRVVAALQKNPELLEEVRGLLSERR